MMSRSVLKCTRIKHQTYIPVNEANMECADIIQPMISGHKYMYILYLGTTKANMVATTQLLQQQECNLEVQYTNYEGSGNLKLPQT